jgi:hypothetical protein
VSESGEIPTQERMDAWLHGELEIVAQKARARLAKLAPMVKHEGDLKKSLPKLERLIEQLDPTAAPKPAGPRRDRGKPLTERIAEVFEGEPADAVLSRDQLAEKLGFQKAPGPLQRVLTTMLESEDLSERDGGYVWEGWRPE